jgi:hypothetical protein
MPLNGSGTYAAPASTFNPAVTNTTVNSTDWTALLADITTALSTALYKDGQATPTANIPMGGFKLTGLGAGSATGNSLRYEQLFTTSAVALLGAMDWVKGADVASAATTNLTTATGNAVHVTGTTTITAITLGSGLWRLVIFDGALTLTHHTTNNNLPGAANITTVAGDRALYWSDGTTVYCVLYVPVASSPIGKGLLDISAAAAGQIKFPATQNASANANTLDDYEEGTWTPSVGGSATYFQQTGHYTKIGRIVTFDLILVINNIGTGSNSIISGLPYTSAAANDAGGGVVTSYDSLSTNVVTIAGDVGNAATSIVIRSSTAAAASSSQNNVLTSSSTIKISGHYYVD